MRSLLSALLLLLLLLLACVPGLVHCTYSHNPYQPPQTYDACEGRVGQPCEVPVGFRRRGCGGTEILSEVSEPLDLYTYGPNVCRTTQVVFTHELVYAYVCYKDWVYDYIYRTWIQQRSAVCQETAMCDTTRNQTYTRHIVNCCSGFSTRPHNDQSHQEYLFQTYYTPIRAIPVGCPLAVADTLLECLTLQGLDEFAAIVNESIFIDLFTTNETLDITVFAPTDAALLAVEDTLFDSDIDLDLLVGNHIINGTVRAAKDLHYQKVLEAFSDLRLFVTTVQRYDTSYITYNPAYLNQYSRSQLTRTLTDSFINGASIINEGACKTPVGTLHIIDQVLMPGTSTIIELLEESGNFTLFLGALSAADIDVYLANPESVRTLFAVPDDEFSEQIPAELFNCLTRYMREPLIDLLLYHLVGRAEYTSSLALQSHIYTLRPRYLRVTVERNENRTIRLGADHGTTVVMADITAVNGVVHVIDNVLIPPGFTFGKCQEFAPTTPPPTMPTTMATTAMATTAMATTAMATTAMPTNDTLPANGTDVKDVTG